MTSEKASTNRLNFVFCNNNYTYAYCQPWPGLFNVDWHFNKANVNGKRVSGHIKADKTCGRAVIIIQLFHYFTSTFPVQFKHFLYMSKTGCLDKPW